MRISIFQSKHHNHRIPFLCVSHIFRDSISHISIKMQFHLYLNHIFCFLKKQAICQTAKKNALFARNYQLTVNIRFILPLPAEPPALRTITVCSPYSGICSVFPPTIFRIASGNYSPASTFYNRPFAIDNQPHFSKPYKKERTA